MRSLGLPSAPSSRGQSQPLRLKCRGRPWNHTAEAQMRGPYPHTGPPSHSPTCTRNPARLSEAGTTWLRLISVLFFIKLLWSVCVTPPATPLGALPAENTQLHVFVLATSWTDFEDPLKTFWGIASPHMWAVLLFQPPQGYLTTSAKQLSPVFRKMPASLHCLDGSLSPITPS